MVLAGKASSELIWTEMTTPSVLYKILSTSCIKDVPPCHLHSIFSSMLQETESQLSDDRRPIATVAPSTSPDVSNFLKHYGIIQKGARVLEMCRLDTLYDHLILFSRWNRRSSKIIMYIEMQDLQ